MGVATSVTWAIIDSGTSLIAGPSSVGHGEYIVDCDATLPDMTVTLGSGAHATNLTISGNGLRIKVCRFIVICECILAISGIDLKEPLWILGDVLMRDYYTVFDIGNAQIGFSPVSSRNEEVEVEKVAWASAY